MAARRLERLRRVSRLHPCLPVPAAERTRLLLAAHLALDAMRSGRPQSEWLDLPAAVSVCAGLANRQALRGESRARIDAAAAALMAAAGADRPSSGLLEACRDFLPIYEAALRSTPWAVLLKEQAVSLAAWRKAALTSPA